jgi:tRNA-dihydrouridine synthase
MLSLYGIESGLRQARKHLGWYLDRHAPAISADRRKTILTSFEPAQVIALMREAFAPEAQGLRNAA